MRILGIETSCDETAIAIVEGRGERLTVKKHLVASQIKIHAKYGGVVPEVAAREHLPKIDALLRRTVAADGRGIDAIAVTAGPGLITSLRVGTDVARTLAWAWGKPLVAVNHLEGHIYANWLSDGKMRFPALVLIVSGGHTELVLMKGHGKYRLLGATRDDAAGEAFDKVGKMLGLGYPGGPAVSKMAARGNVRAVKLPRPMIDSGDYDFSFAGLKTAVLYETKKRRVNVADMCASFEQAVVDVLVAKTIRAAKQYRAKTVLLAGGVAANRRLRYALSSIAHLPDLTYTTDNAAMIAAAGYFKARRREFIDPMKLEPNPNWQL